MQDKDHNGSFLKRNIQNARNIVGIAAEAALVGAVTPIAAPIFACSEASKIFTDAEDASYKKAKEAGRCTAAIGTAGLAGAGLAAILGAPFLAGGALATWGFVAAASVISDWKAMQAANKTNLEPQNDTTTTIASIADGWLEVRQDSGDTENLGNVVTDLLSAQDE